MNNKIFKSELATIVDISKEYNAEKVFLFGSCLENIKNAQDIDIAVAGIKPREFFNYYGKVAFAIKNEIDIVDLHDISKHLYKRIVSEGRIIYERK